MTLGEYLKKKRIEAGFTQNLVAEKIEVSLSIYQKWEIDNRTPSSKSMFRLMYLLKLDIDKLKDLI